FIKPPHHRTFKHFSAFKNSYLFSHFTTTYDNKTLSFEGLNLKGSGVLKNLQDEIQDNEKL
ncbi:hypothetical protein, partial [Campylobacter portucalensis]|uniref:hypothetical protein n=1 Tax=Campylobacter portucalensis TaxID=2608384 RepID=UPI0018A6B223